MSYMTSMTSYFPYNICSDEASESCDFFLTQHAFVNKYAKFGTNDACIHAYIA